MIPALLAVALSAYLLTGRLAHWTVAILGREQIVRAVVTLRVNAKFNEHRGGQHRITVFGAFARDGSDLHRLTVDMTGPQIDCLGQTHGGTKKYQEGAVVRLRRASDQLHHSAPGSGARRPLDSL